MKPSTTSSSLSLLASLPLVTARAGAPKPRSPRPSLQGGMARASSVPATCSTPRAERAQLRAYQVALPIPAWRRTTLADSSTLSLSVSTRTPIPTRSSSTASAPARAAAC